MSINVCALLVCIKHYITKPKERKKTVKRLIVSTTANNLTVFKLVILVTNTNTNTNNYINVRSKADK